MTLPTSTTHKVFTNCTLAPFFSKEYETKIYITSSCPLSTFGDRMDTCVINQANRTVLSHYLPFTSSITIINYDAIIMMPLLLHYRQRIFSEKDL